MPRLLIHSLIFPPDQVSTAYLLGDISKKFTERGWEVGVFTTMPHYNRSLQSESELKNGLFCAKSSFHGAEVIHFPQKKSRNVVIRGLYLLLFHLAFLFYSLFGKSFDIILTPSPPLTAGLLSGLVARVRGGKAIYNVQEIYPDILFKSGGVSNKFIISILRLLEKFTYNMSASVVTIDNKFAKTIKDRVPTGRLKVIPNFVDTTIYRNIPTVDLPDELLFEGKKVIGYVGNLGKVQDWEAVISMIDILAIEDPSYHLLLVGGGSEFEYLQNEASTRANMEVWSYRPREWVPYIINRCDIHVISMNKASDYDGLPSKIYTILACARPILAATSSDSPLASVIKNSKGGIVVPRSNPLAMANALLTDLYAKIDPLNGVEYINKGFSKEAITSQYVTLATELISR